LPDLAVYSFFLFNLNVTGVTDFFPFPLQSGDGEMFKEPVQTSGCDHEHSSHVYSVDAPARLDARTCDFCCVQRRVFSALRALYHVGADARQVRENVEGRGVQRDRFLVREISSLQAARSTKRSNLPLLSGHSCTPKSWSRYRAFDLFFDAQSVPGGGDESSELIVCKPIERIALDLQLLRKNGGDDLQVDVRPRFANLLDRSGTILDPVGIEVSEELLPSLFREPLGRPAGLPD
jgi:hypothetical protein